MIDNKNIIGCIDGSSSAQSVCLYSAWLAKKLNCPLTFLHVIEKNEVAENSDLSGSIGFNSREELLKELVELEGQQAKLMMTQGKYLLEEAKNIALKAGIEAINTIQKHGYLPDILSEIPQAQIMVLGRSGERSNIDGQVGSQLESVIRLQKTPVLISVGKFIEPKKIMIAYDGSSESEKILQQISTSPLLQENECHLVMNDHDDELLLKAQSHLKCHNITTITALVSGNIPDSLCQYAKDNHIDLIIMGAYSSSRLKQFFIGSNTTSMIAKTHIPLLMIR